MYGKREYDENAVRKRQMLYATFKRHAQFQPIKLCIVEAPGVC